MNLLRAGLDKAMCLIQTLIDRTHAGIDRTLRFSHIGGTRRHEWIAACAGMTR